MAEVLDDPVLGRLAWDDEFHWWTAEVELRPGQEVEVIICYDHEFNIGIDARQARLIQARDWVLRIRKREAAYLTWSAQQLVDRRWNKDEPMTAQDIGQLLRLLSIECDSDGSARLNWDDEDVLFCGHGIYTQLAPSGECVAVRMQ